MNREHFSFLVIILGSVVAFNARGQAITGTQAPTRPLAQSYSQPTAGIYDPLEQYRARELYTRFSFWKQQEVVRAGKPVDLGYFGGGYKDVFAGSPAALDSMSTFRTLRITGTAFWVTGLAILVTELVMLGS